MDTLGIILTFLGESPVLQARAQTSLDSPLVGLDRRLDHVADNSTLRSSRRLRYGLQYGYKIAIREGRRDRDDYKGAVNEVSEVRRRHAP